MGNNLSSILKYSLSLGLAGVLLYFVFRNVDFEDFMEKATQVNYTWVVYSIVLSLISYLARAYRWNLLMRPLGFPHLTTFKTSLAVIVGYLANLAFPRLGEVTRCGLMKRTDNVPVSVSLGTVISERVIDLLTLILMILFTFMLEADLLAQFIRESVAAYVSRDQLLMLLVIGLVAFLVILGGLVILFKKSGPKIREFIRELYSGVLSLRKLQNPVGFILSTVVLWTTYYFMSYLIVFSLPDTAHLSWVVGVMLLVTGGIALAIPVQGGFGTYHTLISAMLALYSVDKVTGVFLATLLHTSQVVAIALFGTVALLIIVFLKKHDRTISESPKS